MINIIVTYTLIAALFILSVIMGKLIDKHYRRIERETRREQAKQEQAEISAFYNELILKQIWGDIK